MLLYTIALLLLLYVAQKSYERFKKIQVIEKIGGPKALPFLGNALQLSGTHLHIFNTFLSFCKQNFNNGILRLYIGLQPMIIVYKNRTVEPVLSSNNMISKSRDYELAEPWLKTGLITANGAKWRGRRKLLTPAFHFKILDSFIDTFDKKAKILIEKYSLSAGKGPKAVFHPVSLCTLDVILEAAMGYESNFQNTSESAYVKAVETYSKIMVKRQWTPWIRPSILFNLSGYKAQQDQAVRDLHELSKTAIKQRKLHQSNNENKIDENVDQPQGMKSRLAFLDLLLKHSDSLSDEDIQEEVDTFIFAGHDTTASGITFTLYWISRNSDIQDKIFDEVKSVIEGAEDGKLTVNDIKNLKYTEACIKESLRMTPPAPWFLRLLKEPAVIDGHEVPAETLVMINLIALHRDPEYFPDPEKFDPERFNDPEAVARRPPYAYAPFSAGPRNCIGQRFAMMEMVFIVAKFVYNFKMKSLQTYEDLAIEGNLVTKAGNDVKISFEIRK